MPRLHTFCDLSQPSRPKSFAQRSLIFVCHFFFTTSSERFLWQPVILLTVALCIGKLNLDFHIQILTVVSTLMPYYARYQVDTRGTLASPHTMNSETQNKQTSPQLPIPLSHRSHLSLFHSTIAKSIYSGILLHVIVP
jgi:hypothetical protein